MVTGSEPSATFDAEDLDLAGGLAFVLDVLLSDVGVGDTIEIHSTNAGLAHEQALRLTIAQASSTTTDRSAR